MANVLPPRFRFFRNRLKDKEFTLLDIGSGSGSPSKTKQYFPHCRYFGVDVTNYRNSEEDYNLMEKFYQKDLTKLEFDDIPNDFFDVIMMSHVMEHLHNGDEVLKKMLPKLKPGGCIYIEYPGIKSTRLPSMRDTLNFYDDQTHVRIYSIGEITGILETAGLSVKRSGTRRYLPYLLFTPITMITQTLKLGYLPGGVFWDLLGFAEYVYAVRAES